MRSPDSAPCRIGIDIGGTFTDVVVLGDDGRVIIRKVASTPEDYSLGIAGGVGGLLTAHRIDPAAVAGVVHATTIATNAILEKQGARTGLVTTAGFRDVLEFRRVRVPELYNLHYTKPPPLVPRALRLEVRERLGPRGEIRVPLDEDSVRRAGARLRGAGVEAIAVCLLHAYASDHHEVRVRAILREMMPADCFICCSHEVLPEIREYERTSTTVVNAYLGPVVARYLGSVQERLAEVGVRRPMQVMQSGGGQMSVNAAVSKPAYLVESGPAAGVIAAARLARGCGLDDVITLDIGGTTAKTAIVEGGEPTKTSEYEIGSGINLSSQLVKGAGYAIKLPFVDVSEIGAGGGSHVWFDKGGLLKVGPRSAGASPGPVCYGRGGSVVTLTDAFVALGFLNPDWLVGGSLAVDAEAAREALESQVGRVLGMSVEEAAYGIFRVATANMTRAVKSVSTYRGRDPRDYTLIAFGGNGPVLAAAIAEDLGMKQVLVPSNPGVFSAHGLLLADCEHETVRSFPAALENLQSAELADAFGALIEDATTRMVKEGFDRSAIAVRRHADLRYVGQAFELTVALPERDPWNVQLLREAFDREHERSYGHMTGEEAVEMVNLRVVARVATPRVGSPPVSEPDDLSGSCTPGSSRAAYFGEVLGSRVTPVYRREQLRHGADGPLVVDEYDSTVVVPPGWRVRMDPAGNLSLTRAA